MQKILKIRDAAHLRFVESHKCLIKQKGLHCNRQSCAHHLTFLKNERGMSQKAGDDKTVSICWEHHSLLHRMGEKRFWLANGYSLEEIENIAKELWEKSHGMYN